MTDPPPHREALLELYDVLNPEAPGSWVALVDGRLVTARPTTGGIVYSIRVRLNIGHDPANMVPTLGRGYQLVDFYRHHPELGFTDRELVEHVDEWRTGFTAARRKE